MGVVKTKLKDRAYDIVIGSRPDEQVATRLERVTNAGQVWVVWDAQVYALHGQSLKRRFKKLRVGKRELVISSGEKTKTARMVETLTSFFLSEKISRSDLIVAIGGGALTDLVGFVAATVMRGVAWIAWPTTLLGMVDAAVGGKTGVNHPLGKNLIGAIWQPGLVVCDVDILNTLPERQFLCGLGEVIKYAGLTDHKLINDCSRYLERGDLTDQRRLTRLVNESVKFKAAVVAEDERESSLRMILNLGHTFGHGIERSLDYKRLMHGEAVIIGLLAAIDLSVRSGLARATDLEAYHDLVRRATALLPNVKIDSKLAISSMALDKKRKSHSLRFVLLKRPGEPIIIDKIETGLYRASMRQALKEYGQL